MKKRGFTLAEVLITLGIIGVVAALTAPSLVMNSRNESNAAKLSVTMSNLENAFTNALVQEDVDSILKTSMWVTEGSDENAKIVPQKFVGHLNKYIHLNGYEETTPSTFYDNNGPYLMNATGGKGNITQIKGNDSGTGKEKDSILIYTKNGAVIFMTPYAKGRVSSAGVNTKDAAADLGGTLHELATILYIDVNGKAAPNTFGRDIFMFYLGTNGILYPFGGLDVSIYETGSNTSLWTSEEARYGCTDGNIKGGQGCTARVIADGYKINY